MTTLTLEEAREVALKGRDFDPNWKETPVRTLDQQLEELQEASRMAGLEQSIDEDARTIRSLSVQGIVEATDLEDMLLVNNA
jgi:hypothetical protein